MPAHHRPREPVLLSGGMTARPWQLPTWPEGTASVIHPLGSDRLVVHWDGAGGSDVPVRPGGMASRDDGLPCLGWRMTMAIRPQACGLVLGRCAMPGPRGMQKSWPGLTGPSPRGCATSMLPRPFPWPIGLGGSHRSWVQRAREVSSAGGDARWF